jgi:hypothetical protein
LSHWPQLPPQPSGPHWIPSQSGVHTYQSHDSVPSGDGSGTPAAHPKYWNTQEHDPPSAPQSNAHRQDAIPSGHPFVAALSQ